MALRILEHCCYIHYLNKWWGERGNEYCWTLINFGDHLLIELVDWCVHSCYNTKLYKKGMTTTITLAVQSIDKRTLEHIAKLKGIIRTVNIITTTPVDTSPLSHDQKVNSVIVPDIHTDIVTITNGKRFFVLNGGLIQEHSPGKYITTMGITQRYYDSIQPVLEEWMKKAAQ